MYIIKNVYMGHIEIHNFDIVVWLRLALLNL